MRHARHYSVEEANAVLPWVMKKLERLRSARDDFSDDEARDTLTEASGGNGGGSPGKLVGDAYVSLQTTLALFAEREIVLRDLDRGLVDFPALRDGREVYLCWEEGEGEVSHWHEPDAGHAGRQPL